MVWGTEKNPTLSSLMRKLHLEQKAILLTDMRGLGREAGRYSTGSYMAPQMFSPSTMLTPTQPGGVLRALQVASPAGQACPEC